MTDNKIGILAGEGSPPVCVARGAARKGHHITIMAIKGITAPGIGEYADKIHWCKLGRFNQMIKIMKQEGIKQMAMIGRINQKLSLNPFNYDLRSIFVMMNLPDLRPKSIFQAIEQELEKEGIEILDTRPFLQQYIPHEGVLTSKRELTPEEDEAIHFGYPIAKMVADAEIGQSIAIDRRKAVIAVEAIEGTNKMIERVGQLDIPDSIFIKVSRTRQDFRFDIPTIGITTIEEIKKVGGSVLAVTAEEMLFFQKEEALAFADESDITVVAVDDAKYSNKA